MEAKKQGRKKSKVSKAFKTIAKAGIKLLGLKKYVRRARKKFC